MGNLSNTLNSLLSLQSALDRSMFDDHWGLSRSRRAIFPAVNVFRSGEGYLLKAEISGLSKEDIGLEVKDNTVRIMGDRKPDFSTPESSLHRRERDFGKFDRTIQLPVQIDKDRVEASYDDGILTIMMYQSAADKPAKIDIK